MDKDLRAVRENKMSGYVLEFEPDMLKIDALI